MSIDPEDLKADRLKREQHIRQIQEYLEELDAVKVQEGRLGHHQVQLLDESNSHSTTEKAKNLFQGFLQQP